MDIVDSWMTFDASPDNLKLTLVDPPTDHNIADNPISITFQVTSTESQDVVYTE